MAKIAFTADLHMSALGMTSPYAIQLMTGNIHEKKPDAVVIAGDIGESLGDISKCLDYFKQFERINCPVGVIAGNHDIWAVPQIGERVTPKSDERFNKLIPELVREKGMVWLEEDNMILKDGTAIAGSIAWYDYSHRAAGTKLGTWTEQEFAKEKIYQNTDAAFIKWPYTDPEFCQMVCGALLQRLQKLQKSRRVKKIVVATHVPVFEKQIVSQDNDDPVSCSYFGQITLGKELLRFSKITTVVSGHTHRGVEPYLIERKGAAAITAMTLNSEYSFPRFHTMEV